MNNVNAFWDDSQEKPRPGGKIMEWEKALSDKETINDIVARVGRLETRDA
jgi:hypothetical protein